MESQKNSCKKKPSPPIPPDGGYGWVILFASFMVNVIVDGVCFSVGLFMMEFVDYYSESKGKCSWIGSVLNGSYLSLGPIAAAVANRYGCRKVAIGGGIICLFAFAISVFSPNVTVIIITYGLLGGIGFGFAYLPAIVMVGYYFEKRRAFATGIAVCGSGIGAFIFAPLTEKLLKYYGWKGASLIMAALSFNLCIMGALFRPLKNSEECVKDTEAPRKEYGSVMYKGDSVEIDKNGTSILIDENGKKYREPDPMWFSSSGFIGNCAVASYKNKRLQQYESGCVQNPAFPRNDSFFRSCDEVAGHLIDKAPYYERLKDEYSSPLYKKDIFYTGSITHLPEYQAEPEIGAYIKSITAIPDHSSECSEEVENNKRTCPKLKISHRMTDILSSMIDLSLLKRPTFLIYGLSCFLCMAGFFVPFMFLPSYAVEFGIPLEDAAFLLSIIGITNIIGRIGTGWVSDQSWADCLLINNVALIIGGTATMMVPLFTTYPLMAAYCCVFGMAIAAFVSLRSIIMVELMGLEALTNAFGLVTMCQGLSSFIGAPIAGSLHDATGNYDMSFYVAGGTLALAGIICLPLRRVAHWENKRRERSTSS